MRFSQRPNQLELMMIKKAEPRQDISLRGETHRRLKQEAKRQNTSMAALVEKWICEALDSKHVPHPSASH